MYVVYFAMNFPQYFSVSKIYTLLIHLFLWHILASLLKPNFYEISYYHECYTDSTKLSPKQLVAS
jgi:hypothetical protein